MRVFLLLFRLLTILVWDSASLPTSLLPSASMADITSFQQLAGVSHSPSNSISLTDRDTPLAAHAT